MAIVIFVAMAAIAWIPFLKWIAWGVPIVFFILEKESKFVKFQASTALVIGIIQEIINIVLQIFIWILTPKDWYSTLSYLSGRGWGAWALLGTLSTIIAIAISLVVLYLIYKAYKYEQVELPVIGSIAAKASDKLNTVNIGQSGNNAAPGGQGTGAFCPHCGKQVLSGVKFCGSCGKEIT